MLSTTLVMLLCTCAGAPPAATFQEILHDMLERFDAIDNAESIEEGTYWQRVEEIRTEGLSKLDFTSLTVEEIERLTSYVFFTAREGQRDFAPYVLEALMPHTVSEDGAGAHASVVFSIITARHSSDQAPAAALRAITHPAVDEIFRDQRGRELFTAAARVLRPDAGDEETMEALAAIRTLVDSIPPDFSASNLSHASRVYDRLAMHENHEVRAYADSFRERLLELGRSRLEEKAEGNWWAERQLAFLEHGPTRVQLIGSSAPNVDIAWWSDETEQIELLSDLRGSIVVLDVWGSSCGFCTPALRARTEQLPKFDGEPIRFVAIARHTKSFVVSNRPYEVIATPTIAAEAKATIGYRDRHGFRHTFAIVDDGDYAIAAQYGIEGIPTTIIIDHHGIVRAVRHDPRTPEPTFELLEAILSEM